MKRSSTKIPDEKFFIVFNFSAVPQLPSGCRGHASCYLQINHYSANCLNRSLDKTISTLEMELAAARSQTSQNSLDEKASNYSTSLQKAFVVIGINTAFSSKSRRDSLRETWLLKGYCQFPTS